MRLQPRDFAAALSLKAENGELRLRRSTSRPCSAWWTQVVAADGGTPVDATVALVDGQAGGRPGQARRHLRAGRGRRRRFTAAVTQPEGERELAVQRPVAEPEFTHRGRPRRWGSSEQVSTFTTYFPYAEYRNTNIGRAAELINGTVLKPGETFSLNDTVGERTAENGFTKGFIISDGIFKEDLGGGVSQIGDHDVQRGVLRRPRGRRAQAALVLHRPLPGRPRGDRGVGRPSTCGSRTTRRTAC